MICVGKIGEIAEAEVRKGVHERTVRGLWTINFGVRIKSTNQKNEVSAPFSWQIDLVSSQMSMPITKSEDDASLAPAP